MNHISKLGIKAMIIEEISKDQNSKESKQLRFAYGLLIIVINVFINIIATIIVAKYLLQ